MIVHQPLSEDYTVIPNALLRDERLSMDAIAVACWLLSKPREWRVNLTNLRRQFGRGHEKMQAIMRELIAAGWAERAPQRVGPRGTFVGGDYTVFNVRKPVQDDLDLDADVAPESENPTLAAGDPSPESDLPESENPTPYQVTNLPNTDSNPPYPPGGGARIGRDPESGRAPTAPSRRTRSTRWRGAAAQGCRGAEPPALEPETAARFERLLEAYPESGRLSSDRAAAEAAYAALAPADQEAAIRAAGIEARNRGALRSQARALHRWLERELWRNAELGGRTDPGAARNTAGLDAVRRGQWPIGCTNLVLADSAAGAAWEAHFARFGVRPRWMQLKEGLGAYMPVPFPPAAEAA